MSARTRPLVLLTSERYIVTRRGIPGVSSRTSIATRKCCVGFSRSIVSNWPEEVSSSLLRLTIRRQRRQYHQFYCSLSRPSISYRAGCQLHFSTDTNEKKQPEHRLQDKQIQVWQYLAAERNRAFEDRKTRGTLLYDQRNNKSEISKLSDFQNTDAENDAHNIQQQSSKDSISTRLHKNVLVHFLPANFPHSVASGYTNYAAYGFIASIAGSAAMVLSTQTLLLAVGVVGSAAAGSPQGHQTASIMAGALNWVLKDGIGQFGGVVFASYLGRFQSLDVYPKHWRMVAAMTLDCATLLELLSPMVPTWFVLPIASFATVGKNVGFLTASASRAALHQSLAVRGNTLADCECLVKRISNAAVCIVHIESLV